MEDTLKLVFRLIAGDGKLNDMVRFKIRETVNLNVVNMQDHILINFNQPEPIIIINKIISISDRIDYVKIFSDGTMTVKTRGWPSEIPITL